MNKELTCALVCDLLPHYLEGLTSQTTSTFVDQHLSECETCRQVKRAMEGPVTPAEQARSELMEGLRRAHRRSKRRKWTVVLCVALLLCVCLLPLPRALDRTMPAVRWRPDTDDYEQITIEIRGTYLDFLFRADVFDGEIIVEGVPQSQKPSRLSPVQIGGDHRPLYWEDDQAMLRAWGFIISLPAMNRFMIGLYDENGSWDGATGVNITAPATTREEAVAVTNEVCAAYGGDWLAEYRWK